MLEPRATWCVPMMQPCSSTARAGHAGVSSVSPAIAGAMAEDGQKALPKHACKGQNDCKGQGGGDKKHAGKNDCKGQGACATDGSKK